MILKTKVPGRIVQRKVRKPGGGYRVKPWFKFDENGLKEIDETKITKSDLIKLTKLFEVVEDEKEESKKEKEDEKVLSDMSYQELKKLASEKGINTYKKKKSDLLAELEG